MRTLLITNSLDATADLIINELGSEKFIRLNYDRPKDWSILLDEETIEISSKFGKFTEKDISKCNWRKPFASDIDIEPYNDKYYSQEWKYLLYEIANYFRSQNKLLFNFPMPDYLVGKIYQQRIAKKYFEISSLKATINHSVKTEKPTIVKSLSAEPMNDNKVMYTTEVTNFELDNNLWVSQSKIVSNHDVTVVYLKSKIFAFELDRNSFKGIDWRKDQFSIANCWKRIELTNSEISSIECFMAEMAYTYGRLDFLRHEVSNNLIFLEVNKNGQWAWLDAHKSNGLFRAMIEEYDPEL